MKKILAKFGFIPKSDIAELAIRNASLLAVNTELREQLKEKDERIMQLIADCTRNRDAHNKLKERHDQQQRAVGTLAKTLSGRLPITMNGIRK